MQSTLSEVVSMKTNGQCRIHQRPKRGSRAREAGLQAKTRAPVRNGPATFWLQCDDYCTIHDPHPLANSWKRREAGTAWAQIAVTKTTPVPQHHLCTSLYLFDQLKAIHGTLPTADWAAADWAVGAVNRCNSPFMKLTRSIYARLPEMKRSQRPKP